MNTLNVVDLTQKLALLKDLSEAPVENGTTPSSAQLERFVALRIEIAEKLVPLFKELEKFKMLLVWKDGDLQEVGNVETGLFGLQLDFK